MHSGIQRFEQNLLGTDYAVGDIHGHFTLLQEALDRVGFDPAKDRLFSVGDLIDRGPESDQTLEWLDKPWFHAIQGNHEIMAIWGLKEDEEYIQNHRRDGAAWFYKLSKEQKLEYCHAFGLMPLIIEVETQQGLIGLSHAALPFDDWKALSLEGLGPTETHICQWSRERLDYFYEAPVYNVRAVIHGHTPLQKMLVLGNCFYIDTAGWMPEKGGYFTLLDLNTLLAYT